MEFQVEDDPDPLDVELLEAHIRSEASSVKGLGDEVELAIFVRDAGKVVAGISGWTWGDCCELQSLCRTHLRGNGLTQLIAPPRPRRPRGCSQTVHFTTTSRHKTYERTGYGCGSSRGLSIRNRRFGTAAPRGHHTSPSQHAPLP
jgi:hypothetical protein